MPFYHPTMKSLAYHPVRHGFMSMRSLHKLEGRQGYAWYQGGADQSCRTLAFDTPERAAEWHLGAHGSVPAIIEIDGDVEIEDSGNLHLSEGMVFITGEIPADQVSLYDAEAAPTPILP